MTTTTTTIPSGLLDTDTLTLRQLTAILQPELQTLDEDLEYLALWPAPPPGDGPDRADEPIGRYHWLACYPVTGGSEGHYVHVDRLYRVRPFDTELAREPLFMVKTFGRFDAACRLAAHLGRRLGA
jgi:hypothetical protein